MWPEFVRAVLVLCILLYLPGTLFLKAFRMPIGWALPTAPLISCSFIFITGEVLNVLRIPAHIFLMAGVPLFIAGATYAFTHVGTHQNPAPSSHTYDDLPWQILLISVAVGLVTTTLLYVTSLSSAGAFVQGWDITHHLDVTQAMIDSQHYSSISYNFYSTSDTAIVPWQSSSLGFYPSGWNILDALTTQLAHTDVTIAGNALNFIGAAVLLPLSITTFIAKTFPNKRTVLLAGAFTSGAFAIFPWALFVYGPLYPNTVAFCAMPAIFWVFMQMTRSKTPKHDLILLSATFVLGCISLTILHTSTIFSSIVILLPWCLARIKQSNRRISLFGHQLKPLTLVATFFATVMLIWLVLYFVLIGRGAFLSFWWDSYSNPINALIHVVGLDYIGESYAGGELVSMQPMLTLTVFVGIVWTFSKKQGRWLSVAFFYISLLCAFIISFDVPLKGILSGFWYTDPFRIAATAAISAMPLAAVGLSTLAHALFDQICRYKPHFKGSMWKKAAMTLVIAIFVLGNYLIAMPSSKHPIPTNAFAAFKTAAHASYRDKDPLTNEEREFLRRVNNIIPKGARVANIPYDGSLWAYATNNVHVIWRYPTGYDGSEKPTSAILRKRLNYIASDEEVRNTAKELDVHYVLQLENPASSGVIGDNYKMGTFRGISEITDDTPGFEVVLSEGNMRLYKITLY